MLAWLLCLMGQRFSTDGRTDDVDSDEREGQIGLAAGRRRQEGNPSHRQAGRG